MPTKRPNSDTVSTVLYCADAPFGASETTHWHCATYPHRHAVSHCRSRCAVSMSQRCCRFESSSCFDASITEPAGCIFKVSGDINSLSKMTDLKVLYLGGTQVPWSCFARTCNSEAVVSAWTVLSNQCPEFSRRFLRDEAFVVLDYQRGLMAKGSEVMRLL